jgi:AraC-like DNA-binding protein
MQEFYAQADHLTVSEAEAAIEGIVALTTADARIRLAADESEQVKRTSWERGNAQLGPDEIAEAVNLSLASLYRLLAADGSIRAVLLKRRLDEAVRLMLEDGNDEHSLKKIVRYCGFGGTSQFSRAFCARSAAALPCIGSTAGRRLARSAAHGPRLRSGFLPAAAANQCRQQLTRSKAT